MQETSRTKKKSSEAELDAELDSMKRLSRGSFKAEPGDTDLKNSKVKISMYLDADVLEYFRQRAEQPNAAPYQTQINNELRKVMEIESAGSVRGAADILNNEKFLRKLKEKLKEV